MSYSLLLPHKCTYYANSTQDEYGNLSFGAGRILSCRFAKTTSLTSKNGQGEIYQVTAKCWVGDDIECQPKDKILFKTKTYLVENVKDLVNRDGSILGQVLFLSDYV